MRSFDLCVGLGQHCESTYQIRRILGQDGAHFFDWLEIDLVYVRNAIATDFGEVLRSGRMALTSDGDGALDLHAGMEFYHEFHAEEGQPLTVADIEAQLPKAQEKFAFLAERWREMTASSARVLYVRQDANGVEKVADIVELRDLIATRYPGHDFAILWLGRTPPADLDQLPPGIAFREVPLLPGRWQGDDEAWDALFADLPLEQLWT
ncbi:DUF1796 family putative cysteine peptidase [Kutzneria sp. 744]|jgi:hypothetical protein|uniref:DUF1796 family putative cysteine peptidase n=1 Tax=Kutzneria sp. (strain 744) TaxID=345341 RepID=UPI0003EEBEBF|nr:DUF1796 family putative cysteine peptidase [Kutzneria sp. 744]EWM18767.1 hypothetical protein KUTG_09071 [Kutzneria sp. 744]